MIYYIFYELIFLRYGAGEPSYFIKALNVFQYVTFRTAYATVTALLISLVFGGRVIRMLREMNVGQQIREEGPQAHMAKRGTPTMGGVLIIGSVLISTLLWARLSNLYVWIILISTALFAVIGFLDDYAKVAKRQSLGLTGKQKLAAQFLIAAGVWATLYFFSPDYTWNLSFPFFKQTDTSLITYIGPWFYLAFIIVVLTGASNAVNLTDGLDGLAISVTFIAMAALTAFTYISGDERWAKTLLIDHRPGVGELTVFCGAMAGASLGFLWHNAPPADVFMGDVGSLAIGGGRCPRGDPPKEEGLLPVGRGAF